MLGIMVCLFVALKSLKIRYKRRNINLQCKNWEPQDAPNQRKIGTPTPLVAHLLPKCLHPFYLYSNALIMVWHHWQVETTWLCPYIFYIKNQFIKCQNLPTVGEIAKHVYDSMVVFMLWARDIVSYLLIFSRARILGWFGSRMDFISC